MSAKTRCSQGSRAGLPNTIADSQWQSVGGTWLPQRSKQIQPAAIGVVGATRRPGEHHGSSHAVSRRQSVTTDFLTGLNNTRALFERLNHELSRSEPGKSPLTVMVCELT